MQSRRSAESKQERKEARQARGDGKITASALVDRANHALADMQPELALKFFQRAQSLAPEDTNLMDATADCHLQLDEPEAALALLLRSTDLAPRVNPFKWLFLAQLQEGAEAVGSYARAVALLSEVFLLCSRREGSMEVTDAAAGAGAGPAPVDTDLQVDPSLTSATVRKQITRAHVATAELYLTDLCYDEAAEAACAEHLRLALEIDAESVDAMQCLASLRVSQARLLDAAEIMGTVYQRVSAARGRLRGRTILQELASIGGGRAAAAAAAAAAGGGAGTAAAGSVAAAAAAEAEAEAEGDAAWEDSPEIEFCVATAKLLTECAAVCPERAEQAGALCSSLLEEDDDNVEVWYIAGVAALGMTPPDTEAARYHLLRAREMMAAVREAEGGGYEEQLGLVEGHLAMLGEAGGDGGAEGEGEREEMEEEWTDDDEG